MGEYAIKGAELAAEEINAAGGVLGRDIRILHEDDNNPGIAVQKATKLIQQEKVHFLAGTMNSAIALALNDLAARYRTIFINTGANSDEIRGAKCNYYCFSTDGSNSQCIKSIGRYLLRSKQYRNWYFLTSDYAFGHDLLRISRRLLQELGGKEIGSELIPTGTMDYSSYILKVKNARPDLVFCNVAGSDQTTFLKQYNEFGISTEIAGCATDTALMWNLGLESMAGAWTISWLEDLPYELAKRFAASFRKKYGKPAENQAWNEYVTVKALALAVQQAGTTESRKVIESLEKIKFDVGKGRLLYYRSWDHQLMQPMYVCTAKKRGQNRDKWDVWKLEAEVPGKNEDLEAIAPTRAENPCHMR